MTYNVQAYNHEYVHTPCTKCTITDMYIFFLFLFLLILSHGAYTLAYSVQVTTDLLTERNCSLDFMIRDSVWGAQHSQHCVSLSAIT